MGLGSLFKAVVNTAMLPADAVVDIINSVAGKPSANVALRLDEIADNIDEA